VETNHFVEDFRINAFDEDIWFEGSLCVLHGEGKVVSCSDVLSVVQTPTRSIGTVPALLVMRVVLRRLRLRLLRVDSRACVTDEDASDAGSGATDDRPR